MNEQTAETPADVQSWRRGADEQPLARAQTILFVEDEAFVRNVTCEVLRSAGYQVLTAQNAAEAIRLYDARHSEVELLLTDVVLPGENGRALAGRLRRRDPDLKVLLVTGYAEPTGTKGAAAEEFLAKPFSAEVLLKRVRGLIGGDGVGQELGPPERSSHWRETARPSTASSPTLGSGRDENLLGC